MDKYKKTAGLNYLSENSYKGDGSPGMVMGIASDARGDTNTNEAQKPTTSSNHSTERDKKTYDPAHGHSKPEGGNPQVCHLCKGEGCEPCGHTGEEITKRRNDPKVDEALDSIKKLSGLEENISDNKLPTIDKEMDAYFGSKPGELEEGIFSEIHQAANELSKEEFAKEYPEFADDWEGAQDDSDEEEIDETKHSELNDIKRLSGLTEAFAWDELEEAKRKKRPDLDDLDDEEEKPEDPDADKVPHILMQLKKAQDVDGDHHIKFIDGQKHKLPIADINLFMDKYMDMKPLDREKMQEVAVMSKEKFDTILSFFQPKYGKPEKSIYEDEEMISESQFDEAAGEKDACYHKVKSRYKVWPSAYASGALVKCRKVGASNWGTGGKKKK